MAKDKDWLRTMFGGEKVTKSNVTGFFLQLLATKNLSFQLVAGGNVRLVVSCDKDDVKLYKDSSQWEGIEFRTSAHGGRIMEFKDALTRISTSITAL